MMKKHVSSIVVFGLSLCLLSGVSRGAVDIDITFTAGATPIDFGMTDPSGNAVGLIVDPPGIWDINSAGAIFAMADTGYWGHTEQNSITALFTHPVFHGKAVIKHTSFSTAGDDVTLIRLVDNTGGPNHNYALQLDALENGLRLQGIGNIDLAALGVANNDGEWHEYGWQLDRSNNELKLFFDGVQIGDASYTIPPGNELQGYFGDGSGGQPHNEQWDRYIIKDGFFPEPTTLGLLIPAAALAFMRRRRSC